MYFLLDSAGCRFFGSVSHLFVTSVYRTALTALFGVSNRYLIRGATEYFNTDAIPNPFLRTWSLGVEELFYAAFPALLFLVRTSKSECTTLALGLLLVIGLTVISVLLSSRWTTASPALAYFAMPSRFWELGIGAMLAVAQRLGYFDRILRFRRCESVLRWAGSGILVYAVIRTSATSFPFPGALPAVVGTAMLVAADPNGRSFVLTVLKSRPAVLVGKISYSLYLWHWPIICVLQRNAGEHKVFTYVAASILTGAAAAASYYFIERPIRYDVKVQPRVIYMAGIAVVAFVALETQTVSHWRKHLYLGAQPNWNADWESVPEIVRYPGGSLSTADCEVAKHDVIDSALWRKQCLARWNVVQRHQRMYLFGDSHALADIRMAQEGVDREAFELLAATFSGCRVNLDSNNAKPSNQCERYWSEVRKLTLTDTRPGDFVLLATYWRGYEQLDEKLSKGVTNYARQLGERGVRLIVQA